MYLYYKYAYQLTIYGQNGSCRNNPCTVGHPTGVIPLILLTNSINNQDRLRPHLPAPVDPLNTGLRDPSSGATEPCSLSNLHSSIARRNRDYWNDCVCICVCVSFKVHNIMTKLFVA